MRLIDADALDYMRVQIIHRDGTVGGWNAVVMSLTIKEAPTIDAVPVVRCKDCVHYYKGWGEELCHRGWTPKDVSAEWFCPK